MTKKRKLVFEAVPDERTLTALADGTQLEWVPSWEGVLQWAPADLKNDRNLRIWHTFRSKNFGGRRVRIQLRPHLPGYLGPDCQRQRVRFTFKHKGNQVDLYRTYLTKLCETGFAICDRRHWVIDHKNENTLDDRPSNLQVITQRENCARSERRKVTLRLSPKEKKRQREERVAWMQERKRQLMAIHPEADMMDIEWELALELQTLPPPSLSGREWSPFKTRI